MSRLNAPLSKKRKKSSREKKLQVENHVGWKESNTQSLQRNFKDYSIRAARFETTRSVQNTQMIYWWVDFQRRLLLCYKNDGGKKRNNWRLPVPDCIQDENQWILCSSLKITQTDDVLTDSNNLRDSYTFKIQPTFNLLTVFFLLFFLLLHQIQNTIFAHNWFPPLALSGWTAPEFYTELRLQSCLSHAGRAPSRPDQPFHRIIIDGKSRPAERGTFPPDSWSDIGTDNKQLFPTGSAPLHNPYWPSLAAIQLYF